MEEIKKDYSNKTKGCTLAAGVITIIMGLIVCVGGVATAIVLIATMDPLLILASLFMMPILCVLLGLIILAVGIMYIVFGVVMIKTSGAGAYDYSKKKTLLIVMMVFDLILAAAAMVLGIALEEEILLYIFAAVAGINVISFLLKIIDIIVFNARVSSGKIVIEKPQPKVNFNRAAFANVKPIDDVPDKSKETKLKEIDTLLEKRLITSEEYEIARKNILGL